MRAFGAERRPNDYHTALRRGIGQELGWENETYVVYEVRDSSVERIVAVPGGGC